MGVLRTKILGLLLLLWRRVSSTFVSIFYFIHVCGCLCLYKIHKFDFILFFNLKKNDISSLLAVSVMERLSYICVIIFYP
nr:hypothetical protein Itr_chr15CG04750 [Ipomoea trifida]